MCATWGGGQGKEGFSASMCQEETHLGCSLANACGRELFSVLVPAAGTLFWAGWRKLSHSPPRMKKKSKLVSFFKSKPRKISNANGHFSVQNANENIFFSTRKSDCLFLVNVMDEVTIGVGFS